jgi:flagellar motor protein MotB
MHKPISNPRRAALLGAFLFVVLVRGSATAAPPVTQTPATVGSLRSPPGNPAISSDGAKRVSDVHDLVPGGECPDPGPSRSAAIAAAASALIPLKAGLTLSSIWKAYQGDYEHECLLQIGQIDARSIATTDSCPVGPKHVTTTSTRSICWTDVIDSYLFITNFSPRYPKSYVGALKFNLSLASFAALKTKGEIHHRFLEMAEKDPQSLDLDIDGTLKSDGAGSFKMIINDKVVEVPTIEASYVNHKTNDIIRIKVLDDARFPLLLDYYIPSEHSFFITYTKVSFPTAHELEQHLAIDKHTDVYGIYFDFASDSLRSESKPVLHEIADALLAHPQWKLIINGHTDNIGGDEMNLDLSRRRAVAVRKALVEQYKIDESRLSTNGFGASQPKESNDSDRGRARNRRVELIRR